MEVNIEKLVYGGEGLARHNGLTLFIPGVLPGERVSVEIKERKKGFARAEVVKILTHSSDRVIPQCNGEEECTGASWAYITYPAQLRLKEEIILETLKKVGHLEPANLLPIIPSPQTEHYRLRVQFNVRYEDEKPRIGFFRRSTHELVEIKNAFLLHPLINRSLEAVRNVANEMPPLKEIHMNMSLEGEIVILFFIEMENPPSLAPIFDRLKQEMKEIIGIVSYAGRKRWEALGRTSLNLKMNDLVFQSTEGNFFQVNWEQNKNMVKTVLEFAELKGEEHCLDLYCGIGNFTFPLSHKVKKVVGIETGYSAIEDAKENAVKNGISNVEFICDDVRKGLKALLQKREKADFVLLDPPRAGATNKILERIASFSPKKILYISCNPTTLARDLALLKENGYALNRLQPIDMFPQTYHIECVAEMVRG